MGAGVKVTQKPGPGAATLEAIQKLLAGHDLKVGILGGIHKPEGGEESIPLPVLGAIHEFGLGVPQRSFLRGYVNEHRQDINEATLRLLKSRGPSTETLEVIGQWIVGQIQKRIANRIAPPLSPVTIRVKGSDVPLIDTGQLRAGISYKVVRHGG